MNLRIEEIHARNLGPVSAFTHQLRLVNLVFGQNEKGKTCLVEFIIQSLFKNPKVWNPRGISGSGRVVVSGLETQPVDFDPAAPKKIEDYWENSAQAFPQNFSKLLVVRAAELELADRAPGVDSAILKNYLSGQGFLDKIVAKIPATIQEASIERGNLVGAQRGDLKTLNNLEGVWQNLVSLKEKITNDMSMGAVFGYKKTLEELDGQLRGLEEAKRYKARILSEALHGFDRKLAVFADEAIEKIAAKLSNHAQLSSLIRAEEQNLEMALAKSEHYDWLRHAIEIYESRHGQSLPRKVQALLLGGMVLLGLAVYFFFNPASPALFFSALGLGIFLIAWYIYSLNAMIRRKVDREDIQDISTGFAEKFGMNLFGLADLKNTLGAVQPYFFQRESLEKSIQEKKRNLKDLEGEIEDSLKKLIAKPCKFSQVEELLNETRSVVDTLKSDRAKAETEFLILDIQPAYFIDQKPASEWDKEKFDQMHQEKARIEYAMEEMEQEFILLKQSACDLADAKMTDGWDRILFSIDQKLEEVETDLRGLKAKCIAQKLISEVSVELQKSEDEKIQEGLKSSGIIGNIFQITQKYNELDYVAGEIFLKDEFGRFPLSQLSTGAIEQVFLALRIGFALKAAGLDSLFLILDDAFQFSDWERRPRLVDLVLDLAEDGWQIIYFSMDNHIRDLFKTRAEKRFKDDFKYMEMD